jgi:hypothetical protein
MPANVTMPSPEIERWAARLQHRGSPRATIAAQSCLRRLAWTDALMARLSHTAVPARRVEQTLLDRTWGWMQRVYTLAPQVHLSWHTTVSGALQRSSPTSVVVPASAPAHRLTLRETRLTRELPSHSTTAFTNLISRNVIAERLQAVAMHTVATTLLRIVPPPESSRTESELSDRRLRSVPGDAVESLVTRVGRHYRRFEEPMVRAERVLLQRPAAPVSEAGAPISVPTPQRRPPAQNVAWSGAAGPQELDIAQITDRVVRQLDSRLIAARERFGHV